MEPYHARGDPIRLQFSPTFATGGLAVEFPKVVMGGIGSMCFVMCGAFSMPISCRKCHTRGGRRHPFDSHQGGEDGVPQTRKCVSFLYRDDCVNRPSDLKAVGHEGMGTRLQFEFPGLTLDVRSRLTANHLSKEVSINEIQHRGQG
jgi:hypothetical protein